MRIDEKLTEGMTQRRRVEAALRLPETEPAGPEVTSGCAAIPSGACIHASAGEGRCRPGRAQVGRFPSVVRRSRTRGPRVRSGVLRA